MFFLDFTAKHDPRTCNTAGSWRVNDGRVSLDPRWGVRWEAGANGLVLVRVETDLFGIQNAELRLSLWGGHPGTANKRFSLNARRVYKVPRAGTEQKHCTYTYPVIPLNTEDLVQGTNAFQFTCDRGNTFWGHYMVDRALVRAYLKADNPLIKKKGLAGFSARVVSPGNSRTIPGRCRLGLETDKRFLNRIKKVEYHAYCRGYDDTGSGNTSGWHGFPLKKRMVNHIGTAVSASFDTMWDTRMIPDQKESMKVRALIHFRNGLGYQTPDLTGLRFDEDRPRTAMFTCKPLPAPFWSRNRRKVQADITIPVNVIRHAKRAQLLVKIWDGGEGTVKRPFTINGKPVSIVSGTACHGVVFTKKNIPVSILKAGVNTIQLNSNTAHHGIEVLKPGPVIIINQQ